METATAMREAELRALDLLGRPMPDALQGIVRAAARVTRTAVAEIHVITGTHQITLASTGPELGTCRAVDSYCARIIEEPERDHLVPDVRRDERFSASPFTTSGDVITYASSQLVSHNDIPIGTLCVFDPERKAIDPEMREVLSELAGAVMDILEAQRQHDQLEDSLTQLAGIQHELRRSNEHLAAFAGQVSHDIQGPLSGVLLGLQLLDDELQCDAAAGASDRTMLVRRALSSAERMRATVQGLMDFAALGGTISPACLDMDLLLEEAVADLGARAELARLHVAGPLPTVWGDEVQIRAVVQNLLSNALKYAGHVPDPRIRVAGECLGNRSRISISDNGPGVPPAQHEAIFGLLVRGEGAERSDVDGLGIGLATCRRIVQAHGGELGVRDSAMGGAEFWFDLPLPRD